jgi:iron complex outermembrane receptor protein
MAGDRLTARFSGGEDILALASAAPGLQVENSNGRLSPRFYMRGLGNADFTQAASQPVSIVFDDVPMEKSALKAFPLFDMDDIEVLRGPQGTLFGRNTTAGIIKVDSRRSSEETEGVVA